MPKSNVKGGKHHKRGKKHKPVMEFKNKDDIFAKKDQIYAMVVKKVGGSRLHVECSDKKMRTAIIPGKFFKKIWLNVGDIILCNIGSLTDDSVCYIAYKYTNKEANFLKSKNLIDFDILAEAEEDNDKNTKTTPDSQESDFSSSDLDRSLPSIDNDNALENSDHYNDDIDLDKL